MSDLQASAQKYKPIKEGRTLMDSAQQNMLLIDPDFLAAKDGDGAAAEKIVDKLLTDEKFEQIRQMIDPHRPTVFISMPGTSRRNQIPPTFAKRLADKTGQHFVNGDEHFMPLHHKMMKKLGRGERMFNPRLYKPFKEDFFARMKQAYPDAKIVVVEDIFTTGASVNSFVRLLSKNGFNAQSVIGLGGDTDISPTPKLIDKLDKKFKGAGLVVDGVRLGQELTRSEAETLITTSYKEPPEIFNLMQKRLRLLYDVKVNGNFEAAVPLADISEEISGLKSAGTAQKPAEAKDAASNNLTSVKASPISTLAFKRGTGR